MINGGDKSTDQATNDHALSYFGSWFVQFSYRFSLFKANVLTFVQKSRIQFWLFEQKDMRIEGRIIVSFSF